MFEFKIINADDYRWDEIVKSSECYDFHHTSFFHHIDNDYPCKLLYFGNISSFIALPVVLRPIEGTGYSDITSVYGYAGPVSKFKNEEIRTALLSFFRDYFDAYCQENNVVSVFSRLHPLLEQRGILEGLGEIVDLNRTVSIDLLIPLEQQRQVYRKSLKSELNQLRRKGYQVTRAISRPEIDAFVAIYYETMDRVQANSAYYFTHKYFYEFLDNPSFHAELLIAKDGEKIAAGAVFTLTGNIMQYHLAGTAAEYIPETPMKLILDEARLRGNHSPANSLHLGGGVGGSDDDSLFRFKSAFSKNLNQFSVWKYLVNKVVYRELNEGKEDNGFFPLYRS